MIALFKQINDRQETRLAYEASFFPLERLNKRVHKIVWDRYHSMWPEQLEVLCDADLSTISLPVEDSKNQQKFSIHWEYNSIPTEQEWNKMVERRTRIYVNYRISPLIKDGNGRVAVIHTAAWPILPTSSPAMKAHYQL